MFRLDLRGKKIQELENKIGMVQILLFHFYFPLFLLAENVTMNVHWQTG